MRLSPLVALLYLCLSLTNMFCAILFQEPFFLYLTAENDAQNGIYPVAEYGIKTAINSEDGNEILETKYRHVPCYKVAFVGVVHFF